MPKDVSWNGKSLDLYAWQSEALAEWEKNDQHGIVQATTGSGKSRTADAALIEWLQKHPQGTVSVLVPTQPLMVQWSERLNDLLGFEVGLYGGGKKKHHDRVNIFIINTAVKVFETLDFGDQHLLIADECHRMAAPTFQTAFAHNHQATLGLSATPEREDTGLEVLRSIIGPVVFRYGYEEALEEGVIADFEVCAVQIPLTNYERERHDEAHSQIVNLSRSLSSRYGGGGNLIVTCQRLLANGVADPQVGAFLKAVRVRKEILDTAQNRFKALDLLVHRHREGKVMVFHETIADLDRLSERFRFLNPQTYHSKKTKKVRREALKSFATADKGLLLSCKALVEGVDIPDADVGIMVSGTRSVRSRIQTIGRLLRKGSANQPIIYLFYIPSTSDTKAVGNLIQSGFPKEKFRFMRFDPQQQSIKDVDINPDDLVGKTFQRRKFPTLEDVEKMTFDEFMAGFKS